MQARWAPVDTFVRRCRTNRNRPAVLCMPKPRARRSDARLRSSTPKHRVQHALERRNREHGSAIPRKPFLQIKHSAAPSVTRHAWTATADGLMVREHGHMVTGLSTAAGDKTIDPSSRGVALCSRLREHLLRVEAPRVPVETRRLQEVVCSHCLRHAFVAHDILQQFELIGRHLHDRIAAYQVDDLTPNHMIAPTVWQKSVHDKVDLLPMDALAFRVELLLPHGRELIVSIVRPPPSRAWHELPV
mmetsp:Transcript_45901/g.103390  ORF Transcript_45901/g.103390 Transcript_45901/m.103390 type:complete len:245 (+) Transcript_45901:376-1110(+)